MYFALKFVGVSSVSVYLFPIRYIVPCDSIKISQKMPGFFV